MPKTQRALRRRRDRVARDLPVFTELVRGSLVERYLRCGKPSCHCARAKGHQVWYLTVSFAKGRSEQITVPVRLLPIVRRWVETYDRWWQSVEQVSATNRELLRKRWLDPTDEEP